MYIKLNLNETIKRKILHFQTLNSQLKLKPRNWYTILGVKYSTLLHIKLFNRSCDIVSLQFYFCIQMRSNVPNSTNVFNNDRYAYGNLYII